MTDDGRAKVAAHLGQEDSAAVICEPFLQWVIEDDFATDRPPLAEGARFWFKMSNPLEEMKLRMLNGAHSLLALLGGQAGLETVDAAWPTRFFAATLERFHLQEAIPTLPALPGIDLGDYAAQLRDRFANPALQHRTAQIASDTSQKRVCRKRNFLGPPCAGHSWAQRGTVPPLIAR